MSANPTIRERRRAKKPSAIPRKRIQRGQFVAEIVSDRRTAPRVYHCVIQRRGEPGVLMWTQERNLEEATEGAMKHLTELRAQSKREQESLSIEDGGNKAA